MEKNAEKWKTALLSSGMPLELEASRVLVSKGFIVNSNYKYDQSDSRFIKDISVGLHAKANAPFPGANEKSPSQANEKSGQLELLVECRHRHSDIVWFFLPNPNPGNASPIMQENTIRVVDNFSSYVMESDAAAAFDAAMPVCQKGLEVDTVKGDVDETSFKHGLSQLQYAIPHLLTENVISHIEEETEQNLPFLFCPVFLTNSKLFVLNKSATAEDIEASSRIQDISDDVPYLMIYLDYSKDFEGRCVSEIFRLGELRRNEKAMIVERKRAGYYGTRFNLPFTIVESLMMADRSYMDVFFTRFIICNNSHFPILVDTVREITESVLETKKLIK